MSGEAGLLGFGRLFCDGQLCFYSTTVAASAGRDLITVVSTGKYSGDVVIQLSIVSMGGVFVISTFVFGALTFAEEDDVNRGAAIGMSIALAIGTTALAGSLRWYYHLY